MAFFTGLVRKALKLAVCAIVVVLTMFTFRESIFKACAQLWIVNEPLSKADAVVVLGGGHDWRPFAAADIYLSGKASFVLLAQPAFAPSQELLQQPNDAAISLAVLGKKGVPADRIILFGDKVTSTKEEAFALRQWVLENKETRTVIIPTDSFHTRRVRWVFNKALKDTGVVAIVQAVPHPRYNANDWWRSEEGIINFQNEVVKSVFYAISY